MGVWQAIIIAIVEGLTEFLPISSTGHMIITSSLMGIATEDFTKLFTIAIQFGAILSVFVIYFKRFFQTIDFYLKLFVGFIPAVIAGLFLNDWIDSMLENVWVVAINLLIGGIIFLFIDKWFINRKEDSEMSYLSAFKIGCFQVFAMAPGISRSAATIIGGLSQGLNRRNAAEFSFFLAVPTMFAATVKKIYDYYKVGIVLSSNQISLLVLGNIVAFLVAMVAIKFFVNFLTKHGFRWFGYYRIVVGSLLLILLLLKVPLHI